jgi:hypothetical protein
LTNPRTGNSEPTNTSATASGARDRQRTAHSPITAIRAAAGHAYAIADEVSMVQRG